MDEVVVERFSVEKFMVYWPAIERELRTVPHVWQDFWTLESIRDLTIQGHFQCWGAGSIERVEIVCWSQVLFYPASSVLYIFLAIGRGIDHCIPALETIFEKFAHDMGCKLVQVTGRPGWGPKLRKIGFKTTSTQMIRKLENWRLQ